MRVAEIGAAVISVDLFSLEYWSKTEPVVDFWVSDFIMECLLRYISKKLHNFFKFI